MAVVVFAVCTAAVRNCLECRHRYQPRTPTESGPSTPGGKPVNGVDPIQSLISGSHPSAKVCAKECSMTVSEDEVGGNSEKDAHMVYRGYYKYFSIFLAYLTSDKNF